MLKQYGRYLLLFPVLASADPTTDDPCGGLLAVLNRPTTADSVCVVKPWRVIAEMGIQYQDTHPESNHQFNAPEMQLRLGLPASNEFTLLPPNYIESSGFSETVMGFKHQFNSVGQFSSAAESIVTLPSGSDTQGSDGFGYAFSGILSYAFTDIYALSLMLGYSSQTTSTQAGGDRYQTINPDLVFTALMTPTLQFYAEIYGQSKTGPDQSSGFNADAGIQYLVSEDIEIDLEYGHRISGELANFSQYIGTGAGFRF